jgi:hypothetical protein
MIKYHSERQTALPRQIHSNVLNLFARRYRNSVGATRRVSELVRTRRRDGFGIRDNLTAILGSKNSLVLDHGWMGLE